jgi:hypothetical protein
MIYSFLPSQEGVKKTLIEINKKRRKLASDFINAVLRTALKRFRQKTFSSDQGCQIVYNNDSDFSLIYLFKLETCHRKKNICY